MAKPKIPHTRKQKSILDWAWENPWTAALYLSSGIGLVACVAAFMQEQAMPAAPVPPSPIEPRLPLDLSPCKSFPVHYGVPLEEALGTSGHTFFVGETHGLVPTEGCIDYILDHEPKNSEHTILVEQVPSGVKISCDSVHIATRPGRTCVGWDYMVEEEKKHMEKRNMALIRYQTLLEKYQALNGKSNRDSLFTKEVNGLLLHHKTQRDEVLRRINGKFNKVEMTYGRTGLQADYVTLQDSIEFLESFIEFAKQPNNGYSKAFNHFKYLEKIPYETFMEHTPKWLEREQNRSINLVESYKKQRKESPQKTLIIWAGVNHLNPKSYPQQGLLVHKALHDEKKCTYILTGNEQLSSIKIKKN